MKKMKVRYLISLLIIILITGCTSIKSSHEISLDKIEGRKSLIVNYDRSEIQSVEDVYKRQDLKYPHDTIF